MFKKESKKFVKVCPICLSPNLSVRIFDMGSYYDCKDCDMKQFYPLEFEEKDLEELRKKVKKKTVEKINGKINAK